MKKIILILTMLISLISFSQTTDSIYVMKETDSMNDKTYFYPNKAFVIKNETGKIGFRVSVHIDGDLSFSMITVTMVGIGSCNENDEIIILLENGTKITKKSWAEFNCDGKAYFNLDESEITLIKTSPISKIRLTNGRTYESYTGDIKPSDKRWFIQLFYCLDNKIITELKK